MKTVVIFNPVEFGLGMYAVAFIAGIVMIEIQINNFIDTVFFRESDLVAYNNIKTRIKKDLLPINMNTNKTIEQDIIYFKNLLALFY
jgi:hypothetical protein